MGLSSVSFTTPTDTRTHATPVSMRVTLLTRLEFDTPEYISYRSSPFQLQSRDHWTVAQPSQVFCTASRPRKTQNVAIQPIVPHTGPF